MTTAAARRAETRARSEAFQAALHLDWLAQEFAGSTRCFGCGDLAYCRGPRPARRRCETCHGKTRTARARARRRTAA